MADTAEKVLEDVRFRLARTLNDTLVFFERKRDDTGVYDAYVFTTVRMSGLGLHHPPAGVNHVEVTGQQVAQAVGGGLGSVLNLFHWVMRELFPPILSVVG